MSRPVSATACLFAGGAVLLLAGCSTKPQTDYAKLGLVGATGRVTLDGEALPGVYIVFEAPDQTYSYGRTDSAGAFALQFNSEIDGVTPGPKTVRITTRNVTGLPEESFDGVSSAGVTGEGDDESTAEDPDAVRPGGPVIPARYNSESELTAKVDASHTNFVFDLTS